MTASSLMVTENALSRVPPDVERLIVEDALEDLVWRAQGAPTDIPALLLTCRRFTTWSYPIFCRSICLRTEERVHLLHRTLTSSPSVAAIVRILVFTSGLGNDDIRIIFSKCRNLTHICLWDFSQSLIYDFSALSSLTHLSCDPHILGFRHGDSPPPESVLRKITHFDLCGDSGLWFPTIASLSNLTHVILLVDYLDGEEDIYWLLPTLPRNIRVCVLVCLYALRGDDEVEMARSIATGERHPRVVLAFGDTAGDMNLPFHYIHRFDANRIPSEWTTYDDGPDIWEEAEHLIRERSGSA